MGLNPCGLIGKSTFNPIHKIENWKKGSRLSFLRASSKNPSPRAPQSQINPPAKVPLMAFLNIKVPDKIPPPNTEYTVELTSEDLPKTQNFLGIQRSNEYREVVKLLNRYHIVRLCDTPDRKTHLEKILTELETACKRYIDAKGKSPGTVKTIREVLNQAENAINSIKTLNHSQTDPPDQSVGADSTDDPNLPQPKPSNTEYSITLTSQDLPKKQNFLGRKRSKEFRNIERLLDLYHRLSKTSDSRDQLKDILENLEEACNKYVNTKGKNYDTKKVIEGVLNQVKNALNSINWQTNLPPESLGFVILDEPPPFIDANEQPPSKPAQLIDLESSLDILDHSRQHHVNSNELHNAIASIAAYLCNIVVPDQGNIFNRITDNLVHLPKEHLAKLLCLSMGTNCLGELDTIADALNRLGITNQAQRIRNFFAKSLCLIAEEFYEQGQYNDVLGSLDIARKQFQKLGDDDNSENTHRLKANYYIAIAENLYQQGQYNDALNSVVNAKSVLVSQRGRNNDNVENTQRLIDNCHRLIDKCNFSIAEELSQQSQSKDSDTKKTIKGVLNQGKNALNANHTQADAFQSLPSQNLSAAQTLYDNCQHDNAMLHLLKAKKGFKVLSDADGLKDTMQLMGRIHLARAGKLCQDPNNKVGALKILNTFVLPICRKLSDDVTLAFLQNSLLPCLESKSLKEGEPQDIPSLFDIADRIMGRIAEQQSAKEEKVSPQTSSSKHDVPVDSAKSRSEIIFPFTSQHGFFNIEDIPVENYKIAKQHFEDNYIKDKVVISGKDSNCFIRCFAKYAASKNKINENEVENVVSEVAKMLDDSGLRKRLMEGGSYPFIEDLAFPPSDPVAMAVKKYFDKKYRLDIATNQIIIGRRKDNSASVMQQCSDRNAQDVIFMQFINNNHFELIFPKSEKLTGWDEREFNDQNYQSREAENDFLWNVFKDTSEGKPFSDRMEKFDKLLNEKLSLHVEPKEGETSREEEMDSKVKIDSEKKVYIEDAGATAKTRIATDAADFATTTAPFANPRALLQMAGLTEAEVNRLSEKHINKLARFASHEKIPCDTEALLERLKDALDKTGKALETSLSKVSNLGKNGKKAARRGVELKIKTADFCRYLDIPKTKDFSQSTNEVDKNRDDRFVPLIGQEILIFMAEAETYIQETLGLLEMAGGHDEDIAKLGRDWLNINSSPKLSVLNDTSLQATLETDFEGRPCLYLRTGEVAQKTVPPLTGHIYTNKKDALGHEYPPSDLDSKYKDALAKMDEVTDLFVARYSEISSSQIKNEIRMLLHEFDAIRKAACQWNQSRDKVTSFFEDLINEITGKLTKVSENLRSYLKGQKIDSLFFKGMPTPGFETILTALRGTAAPTISEDSNRIPALNLWGEAEKALKTANKLATDRFLPILQRRHLNSAPFLKGQRGMMKMQLYIQKNELGKTGKDLRTAMEQLGAEIRNTDNPKEVIDYIKAAFESDGIQTNAETTKPENEAKKAEAIKTILLCIEKIKIIENDFSVVNTAEKLKYSTDLMVHRVKDDDWWDDLFKSRGSDKLRRFIAIADHGLDRVPLGDAFRIVGHTIGLLGPTFGKTPYHFSREIKSYATEKSGGLLSWPGFHQWGKRLQNPQAPISYAMAKPLCELLKQLQELDNWLLDQINKLDSKRETRKEPERIHSEGLNTLANREVRYRHLRATYLAALATIMNGGEIPKKVVGMRIEAWSKMHNVDMQELEYLVYNRCQAAIESTSSDKALEYDIKSAMAKPDAFFNRLKQYRRRVAAFAPNYSAKPAFENLVRQILELNKHEQDWATRLAMRMDGIADGKVGMGEGVLNNPYLSLYTIAEHAEKFGTVTNEVNTALNLHFAGATMIPVLFSPIVKHVELFSDYKIFPHHGLMTVGVMDNNLFRFHVTS